MARRGAGGVVGLATVLVLLLLALPLAPGRPAPAAPLTAQASAQPAAADAPATTSFQASAAGGTPPYSFAWRFGATGGTAVGANASFTFATPGTYVVTLTVTDGAGAVAEANVSVVVAGAPTVAIAVALGAPGCVGGTSTQVANFSASVTGGTAPYEYLWTFPNTTATGKVVAYAVAAGTTVTASLVVADGSGASAYNVATVAPAQETGTSCGGGGTSAGSLPIWVPLAVGGVAVAIGAELVLLRRRRRRPPA